MTTKGKPRVRTSTGARVQLTIELSSLGSWGPDCALSQVYDQALEAAISRVRRAFAGDSAGIKIVGVPGVVAITTDMDKRS